MTRFRGGFSASLLAFGLLLVTGVDAAHSQGPDASEPWLRPYTGPTRADVDATTLDGKVLCGYQGWFNTPGDGTTFGFTHWGQGLDRPDGGRFTVDIWPDVTEYDPQDLCAVPGLTMPDGSPARLYSAFRKGPVLAALPCSQDWQLLANPEPCMSSCGNEMNRLTRLLSLAVQG